MAEAPLESRVPPQPTNPQGNTTSLRQPTGPEPRASRQTDPRRGPTQEGLKLEKTGARPRRGDGSLYCAGIASTVKFMSWTA